MFWVPLLEGEKLNKNYLKSLPALPTLHAVIRGFPFDEDKIVFLIDNDHVNFAGLYWYDDSLYFSLPKHLSFCAEAEKIRDLRKHNGGLKFDENSSIKEILPWIQKRISEFTSLTKRFDKELRRRDQLYRICNNTYNEMYIALRMIDNYCERGPLVAVRQRDHRYRGQINWGKTIDRCIPDYLNNTPIYTNQIRFDKTSYKDDVTRLEESILFYMMEKFSFFLGDINEFTEYYSEKTIISEADIFLRKLEERRQFTFLDNEVEQMELIKSFIDNHKLDSMNTRVVFNGSGLSKGYAMSVQKFDVIFELMIGEYYKNEIQNSHRKGLEGKSEDVLTVFFKSLLLKDKINLNDDAHRPFSIEPEFSKGGTLFYPDEEDRADNYNLNIPDVVFDMEDTDAEGQNCCVVIDAKYYKLYKLQNGKDWFYRIPRNKDIYKQFFYGEIVRKVYEAIDTKPQVYNIFIFPKYYFFEGGIDESINETTKAVFSTEGSEVISKLGKIDFTISGLEDKPILIMSIDVQELIDSVLRRRKDTDIVDRRKKLISLF